MSFLLDYGTHIAVLVVWVLSMVALCRLVSLNKEESDGS